MSSVAQDLFTLVSNGLWDLLDRYRTQATAVLSQLQPEPGLAGTPLDGRLLQALRPDQIAGADPGVTALINGLKALLPSDPNLPHVPVQLHGFDPGGGQPRGLALAFVVPGAPALTVVTALTGAGAQGIAFEIGAAGRTGKIDPTVLHLLDGWSVTVQGDAGAGGRLEFPRRGSAQVLGVDAPVSLTWTLQCAPGADRFLLGPADGPHIELSSVTVSANTIIDGGGQPSVSFSATLPQAKLSLNPDALKVLLGESLSMPLDLDLDASPDLGFAFKGGGVRLVLPTNLDLPGIDLKAVTVDLQTHGLGVQLGFAATLTGSLPGIPLNITVDGLGVAFPITVGDGGLGIDPGGVKPVLPSGLGLDLSLPVLPGGGFVKTTGPGAYAGLLSIDLAIVEVQAFALLQLPIEGHALSFAAILSIQFPFPGIQISSGFSLNGVGGIVAINRRLDRHALEAAVLDGSVNQLLFPVDPASHGPAIVATLGHIFPAANGHIVIGPMLQIGWGGRLLTLSAALVLDLPDPAQIVIIGRLTMALPDPLAPIVLLQATLSGTFTLSPVPTISIVASLAGSRIATMPLHGDLMFLLRGGDDAVFILSVGGFHPRYVRPAGIPALARIQIDMTPPELPGMRSSAYVAVTSNSIQFGCHLELCYEVAGCGVDGWFDFDALFLCDPTFSFAIHCSAGVAVQVMGESLMGITLDLVLEGPAPWHAHGTGKVELFLFSASLDFDVHWGSAATAVPPPPDLGPILTAAFADHTAWVGAPPVDDRAMVTLSSAASKLIAGGKLLHPLGRVVARQRAVPLEIRISRYQNRSIPPQTWKIAAAQPQPGAATMDEFPAAPFLDLSDDDKLTRPAFESFPSGATLTPGDVIHSELRTVNTDFETVLIPEVNLGIPVVRHFVYFAAETSLATTDVHTSPGLWKPADTQPVVVLATQPVAAASTSTLVNQPLDGSPDGYTHTRQAAEAQFGSVGRTGQIQIVERWELVA